jgi:uncharacterized protein with HEPN domain
MRRGRLSNWQPESQSASLKLTASRDALLWNFTVLGEASGQLSAEVRDKFPDMPWQQPVRLRNRIVHGYWSIDLDVLHTTAV